MEERPCAVLLKFPGTNCDEETARAFETVGFVTEVIPISVLKPESLVGVSLVVLSGGFSYGDYVMAGRLARLVTEQKVGETLREFRDNGGFLLGICNGFQILTQLDLLPAGSLVENTSGRFQCQWVTLENKAPDSPFLSHLPESFEFPIAHAEGRLVTSDASETSAYLESGAAALTYSSDVNGSFDQIAGLQDESGRVFGLMPHPERFLYRQDHYDPDWSNGSEDEEKWGSGYYLFRSLYESVTSDEE
ncbi:MAG: phosphoribosylformylglycinamidine synthase subunit PurQ [Verrucomicrobiales bacterium]|nr:phosphoribosylformylglycinamidine synthase subunit PurQ [Verrucomicrobiales bacterium]